MRSQLSLKQDIDSFVDSNLRPNLQKKYINYSAHIWGTTPEFKLGINIPPYRGTVHFEIYNPFQERYGNRSFDGFEGRLTTLDEKKLLKPTGLITNHASLPDTELSFRAQIANSSFTMFGTIATTEYVEELRSRPGADRASSLSRSRGSEYPVVFGRGC